MTPNQFAGIDPLIARTPRGTPHPAAALKHRYPTLPPASPPNPTLPPSANPAVACNPVLPGVTACYPTLPNSKKSKNEATEHAVAPPDDPPLDHRRLAAIRLLLAGRSLPAAAHAIGVHRQTLWRWSREQAFAAELHRLHQQLVQSRQPARTPTPAAPRPVSPQTPDPLPPDVRALLDQYGLGRNRTTR